MGNTKLTYMSDKIGEALPSSHNGLGYKNLIKFEFLLADFSQKIEQGDNACIGSFFNSIFPCKFFCIDKLLYNKIKFGSMFLF